MLEQSLFISLSVIAIWGMMNTERMILSSVDDWLYSHTPWWLYKPLSGCCVCMTPWYGGVLYVYKYGITEDIFLVLLIAMGINTVFVRYMPPDPPPPTKED